jgi:hypothetical protein
MAAGIALITFLMLRRLWRRRKRERAGAETHPRLSRQTPTGQSATARGRETLDHLMVEVQELTRLCAAQMENRALRLEKLIREADERIARLEALEHATRSADPWDAGRGGPPSLRYDNPRPHAPSGASTSARPSQGGRASLLAEDDMDPLTRRVYTLADQGLTPVEIAGRLEEQVGKVELILALRGH